MLLLVDLAAIVEEVEERDGKERKEVTVNPVE